MSSKSQNSIHVLLLFLLISFPSIFSHNRKTLSHRNSTIRITGVDESPIYMWLLLKEFRHGDQNLTMDPNLMLETPGFGSNFIFLVEAFERYKELVFEQRSRNLVEYDVKKLSVVIASDDETLQFGVDKKYTLYIEGSGIGRSIVNGAIIEANTIFGALRGLWRHLDSCVFLTMIQKTVKVLRAPWYIHDEPRFSFRGLLLDTSRHFLPVHVIKQVIESMSYAKL